MAIREVSIRDFRSYREFAIGFAPGLTAILGDNGNGKSNLLEAIGYFSTLKSFRGAPTEALIRRGEEVAILRAVLDDDGREVLIEAEVNRSGSPRVLVNRQRLVRARDLLGVCSTTIFSPDDLAIAKGSPALRRDLVDDLLVAVHPKNDAACAEVAKILRQRNALLKQCGGRLNAEAAVTLDVWDQRLVEVGERLGGLRTRILGQLEPLVNDCYVQVADNPSPVRLSYESVWRPEGLASWLERERANDVRRGVSTVGPHRDDLSMSIGDLPARTHASQGEQRSLVLALRLASHQLVKQATGLSPILLLDDVFSELDDHRAAALLETLPECQTVLTSATGLPPGTRADLVVRLEDSSLTGTVPA